MMGPRQKLEPKLFYTGVCLDDRIPDGHILRQIREHLDFGFVRAAVADCYGGRGNESVDPIVLMKLMIVLFMERIPSERELMRRLGYRLDWMWFCGYDLDDTLPHHSVLSKARALWGPDVFADLFAGILKQCIETGLVGGDVVHMDGSCVEGNVDMDRLQPVLRLTGKELYERLEQDVEPIRPSGRLTSQSDGEAGVTRKNGQTVCGYKDHRVVDDAEGIITATATTDAARSEGYMLPELLEQHQENTESRPDVVVADKQYGTAENYGHLHQQGIRPCISRVVPKRPKGFFGHERFTYDPQNDVFVCPAGEQLHPYHRNMARKRVRYKAAKGPCAECKLRSRCTDSKHGRRVERHMDQEHIDWADGCLTRGRRRQLMRRRKIRAEGSFAEAERYGFKRSRWRGLVKARIQNLLIASIQNLRKLLKALRPARSVAKASRATLPGIFYIFAGLQATGHRR